MENNTLIHDRTKDRTRTLIFDMPMPDLLHALFTSDAYLWHTKFTADVDVSLLTEEGMKTAKVYPHDGDITPKTFDDYFQPADESTTPTQPHNKSAITLVDYEDTNVLNSVAEEIIQIAKSATVFSQT